MYSIYLLALIIKITVSQPKRIREIRILPCVLIMETDKPNDTRLL
jgi:hypothetical protein